MVHDAFPPFPTKKKKKIQVGSFLCASFDGKVAQKTFLPDHEGHFLVFLCMNGYGITMGKILGIRLYNLSIM